MTVYRHNALICSAIRMAMKMRVFGRHSAVCRKQPPPAAADLTYAIIMMSVFYIFMCCPFRVMAMLPTLPSTRHLLTVCLLMTM